MAFVGNGLIGFAETFEKGHGEAPAVSSTVTKIVSVGGGIVFGLLLGAVVFGLIYYFLEPAIPGAADTKSYIFAAAGSLIVSGAPWALLPSQPPGVSQTLPTETRLLWYGIRRLAPSHRGWQYTCIAVSAGDSQSLLLPLVHSSH